MTPSRLETAWLPLLAPLWPLGLIVVAAGMVLLLTLFTYRGQAQAGQRRRMVTLIALRLTALLVVVLMLLQPTWEFRDVQRLPGKVVLLFDASRSMLVKDADDGQSRWAAAIKEWRAVQDLLPELEQHYNLRVMPLMFDAKLREFNADADADGQRTALYEAVQQALEKHKPLESGQGEQLLGLVVLTDGRDNLGRPTLERLLSQIESYRVPVHTIGLGQPGSIELQADLAALSIDAPKRARIKDRLIVRGEIQAQRYENQEIEVFLLIDGQPAPAVADGRPVRLVVKPTRPSQKIPLEMPAARLPERGGDVRVSLKIRKMDDELTESNNEVSTYITLSQEGLAVLYIDKDRAWEPKFLKRALSSDERITLYPTNPGAGSPEWRQEIRDGIRGTNYDVIILGDVPAERFAGPAEEGPPLLELLRQHVLERGAGLLLLGGHSAFADGGWDRTPLAEVAPVLMNERGQLEGPIGGQRAVRFLPTAEGLTGRFTFPLRLDITPERNKEWWLSLQPLEGGSKLGQAKPTAVVLAETPESEVLLAVQDIGKGRSAALAVDTTWRWVRPGPPRIPPLIAGDPLAPPPLSASSEAHLRFWRQLILWLGKQEEAGKGIILDLATRRLATGKELSFTVQAREVLPGGARDLAVPLAGVDYTVKVITPGGGEEPLTVSPLGDAEVRSRGIFWKTDEPGEYELVVAARHQGKDLGETRARFLATRDDSELLNRSTNHSVLEQLATAAGGTHRLHGGLRELLEKLASSDANLLEKVYLLPNWQTPDERRGSLLLGLFVGCLILEWVLRRWWGWV